MNSGDTAWVLIATALVMLMTPAGLALFYGGLSNKKSVINTVGMSYVAFCVASVIWVIAGYSLAFGQGQSTLIGSFQHLFLKDIAIKDLTGTIPTLLFVIFQGVFAAIAVAIISGSVVGRIKFSTWLIFSVLWVLLVYSPLVHQIWGEGFLSTLGELDFAGGTVIHVNAGIAGLVIALILGRRKNHNSHSDKPFSLKLTVLGSALLWFGWFGFNAGSQLAADAIAANALLVTNIAACTGGIGWMIIDWLKSKKPTLLGLSSGVISGLVGITPAAGYVDVSGAMVIGLISGFIGYYGVIILKNNIGYDDTLDAFGIHGLVGIWGSMATGLFTNPAINDAAGLFYGNPWQLLSQGVAVLVTIIYSAVGSFVLFKVASWITNGARIDSFTEITGIDEVYHQEKSFTD